MSDYRANERCENCLFKQGGSEPSGCLRHSPIGMSDTLYRAAQWPLVRFDQWCGDWQPKQSPRAGRRGGRRMNQYANMAQYEVTDEQRMRAMANQGRNRIDFDLRPTAAETMTELQLRLWCLWMCNEFASESMLDDPDEWASEGGDDEMLLLIYDITRFSTPLTAWELSERML